MGKAVLPGISLSELVRRPSFQRYVDEAIGEGIDSRVGPLGVMEPLRVKIKQQLSRAAISGLEALLSGRDGADILSGEELEPVIADRLGALDAEELEGAVREAAGRELGFVKYAGGALGGIVGLSLGVLSLILH